MLVFSTLESLTLEQGKLSVLRQCECPPELGGYAPPIGEKVIRYADDFVQLEVSSLRDFPGVLRLLKVDWRRFLVDVKTLATFVAAAAFAENGRLVNSQPLLWSTGSPTGRLDIDWAASRPKIDGSELRLLGEYSSGRREEPLRQIYEVTCNLATFETQRTKIASYTVRLA